GVFTFTTTTSIRRWAAVMGVCKAGIPLASMSASTVGSGWPSKWTRPLWPIVPGSGNERAATDLGHQSQMRLAANERIVRRRSMCFEDRASTPAAGVAGVGRDAGLLAEILQ